MLYSALLSDRAVIRLSGSAVRDFLQGLITNDIRLLAPDAPLFAAMLSAQGKFQHDFFIYDTGDAIWLDVASAHKAALIQKLTLYRLRADVRIQDESEHWHVLATWADAAGVDTGPHRDPRHPRLGSRIIVARDAAPQSTAQADDYNQRRISLGIPEGFTDLTERTFILEAGYDHLHGVRFDKGCYVGQEVTARMHYRKLMKKCFFIIQSDTALPAAGAEILCHQTPIGFLTSSAHQSGLAMLRFHDALCAPEALTIHTHPIRAQLPEYLKESITLLNQEMSALHSPEN